MLFTLSVNCSKSDGFIVALVVCRYALLLLYRAVAAAVNTADAASALLLLLLCFCSCVSRFATTIVSTIVVRAVACGSHSKSPAFALFSRWYFYDFSYTFELLSLLLQLLPQIPRYAPLHLQLLCAILSLPPTQLLLWSAALALLLYRYVLAISCLACWAFRLQLRRLRCTSLTVGTGFLPPVNAWPVGVYMCARVCAFN